MNPMSSAKPRICAISHVRASRIISAYLPNYTNLADIRIINQTFDGALKAARDLEKAGEVDVFLSGGSNGEYLRNNVSVPVVLIKVTGFDILKALVKARKVSDRVAIVTYKVTNPELEIVKQALNISLEQRSYTTIEDAKDCFRDLVADGYKVIVGSSIITELAEQHGLTGILLYSENSICRALEDAIEIARITKIEENRRERLNTILRNLNEGVVAVDMEEKVQSINPAMEKLLDIPHKSANGTSLSSIVDLGLQETLRTGMGKLNQIQKVGYRTIVASRIPIFELGVQTGAVLTCQDATIIQQADRSIRSQSKMRNTTAKYELTQILGTSAPIQRAKVLANQYAKTKSTILITGETGTGKELFAQGIHNASPRKNNPFVAINCAAFPETLLESELFGHEEGAFSGSKRGGKAGLFEAAHTGTIFLDEIGDMPFPLQTRLLRVLQEKEILRVGSNEPMQVDIRVIAATNRNLKQRVSDGNFREDLFYRLNILCINLPPLRERIQDLPPIAAHLLNNSFRRLGSNLVEEKLLEFLLPYFRNYSWPGNIRELENVIERLAHYHVDRGLPDTVDIPHLQSIIPEIFSIGKPPELEGGESAQLKTISKANEAMHIERVLAECGGNYAETARKLGISRTTLWRRLHQNM
ncbi:MAG: propionate catabolism operon regulatory protein PrpR [Deltaproteobacteria bacterium]|nr:propionate catabolism operon regulatory protein PrpR [Deltaproteobacteria bacterium]